MWATQLEVGSPGRVHGAYAIWLRTPAIAERALQYEQVLYGNLAVPLLFRELVVLVAARFWTADALWTEHRDRALDAGLSADLNLLLAMIQEDYGVYVAASVGQELLSGKLGKA